MKYHQLSLFDADKQECDRRVKIGDRILDKYRSLGQYIPINGVVVEFIYDNYVIYECKDGSLHVAPIERVSVKGL